MQLEFKVDKIVQYLEQYKDRLPSLYQWKSKSEKLVDLKVISSKELKEVNAIKNLYEKELFLKPKIQQALSSSVLKNQALFDEICLWIIKEWGGIRGAKDSDTLQLLEIYKNNSTPSFHRIASSSKVGSFMFPEKYIIYDSRVAYALNWILLSENASNKFFPIPEGRNSKMLAFDMNVLIRLKNIEKYQENQLSDLDNRQYINKRDKDCFIPKESAYEVLNKLVIQIHQQLWKGDKEKTKKLYFTEMLLFSIADKEIYSDITKRVTLGITPNHTL
ncbi:hypothetical protein [Aureispira sp. CCB-E]|uniref:hypothetical protein n=1 Tax=Aureispira sp. CCB-E TaxID=3051121 RepID=UPI0028690BE0|nr:hypothetical protein [Aureispira sp. CCB-E]WMX13038.1 hypothetical protein QP953_19550 [Aureispira sp. CCB-E]